MNVSRRREKATGLPAYHCKIDIFVILERVQETDKPLTLGGGQDVSLGQYVADLIQLEQQLLAHDLQGANLLRIFLLCEEDLTVATLADLRQDLEVTLSESHSPLAEIRPLPTSVLVPHLFIGLFIGIRRSGVFGLEGIETALSVADVSQKVEVVVEEICAHLTLVRYIGCIGELRERLTELSDIN